MVRNKRLILKKYPTGYPVPGQDLTIEVEEFDLKEPPPKDGLILQNIYASFDPSQRTSMTGDGLPSLEMFELGDPITGAGVAKVLETYHPKFKKGDMVMGMLPIEEYTILSSELICQISLVPNPPMFDLPNYVGVLGISGITAFGSFYLIGEPRSDETIFISSAAGAVGHLVGQLAKLEGLKVIGSVGTDEKLDYILKRLKFDGGFNYKKENPLNALKRLTPDGINTYFDSVGGEQLDAALEFMNENGRIICCGMISDYNKDLDERYGLKNLINVTSKNIRIEGCLAADFLLNNDLCRNFVWRMSALLRNGSLRSKIHMINGIDNGPEGFVDMLNGKHFGKTILQLTAIQWEA